MVEPAYEAIPTPQLNVIVIEQLFCPDDGIRIATAYEGSKVFDVAIFAN
jgi:hypothetical protein